MCYLKRVDGLIEAGSLFQRGEGRGGVISFSKDGGITSLLRTIIRSGKAQVQEIVDHVAEDQKQI